MSKQKTVNEDQFKDWNSEIRIRHVKPETKKKLAELQKLLKLPFESKVVEHLVNNYLSDQSLIRQLQQRNNDLHKRFSVLVARENNVKFALKSIIEFEKKSFASELKGLNNLLKQFGTVTSTGGQRPAKPGRKSVPKKGGDK